MEQLANTLTCFEPPSFTAEQAKAANEAALQWEKDQLEVKMRERIARSCIPIEFKDAVVSRADVLDWTLNPGYGLILKGKPGRGKTYEACGALKILAGEGSIRFISADAIVREYSNAKDRHDDPQSFLNSLTAPRVLLIDDLGKEEVKWNTLSTLFAVIDRRTLSMRPTIITTNLDGKTLFARYSEMGNIEMVEALISRMSRYRAIELLGADRRRSCATK